jgi:hypothetical protein
MQRGLVLAFGCGSDVVSRETGVRVYVALADAENPTLPATEVQGAERAGSFPDITRQRLSLFLD